MDNGNVSRKPKSKKPFVLHNTPVWLDQHQHWISDGARQLYKTLRSLADVSTNRLFIPGRGWIELRTIEKKAGISHNTRKKYFKELARLGGLTIHRDYVTRLIGGRNLKVLGPAQVTICPLVPPPSAKRKSKSPPKTSVRPTDQVKKPPKPAVPPTDQTPTDHHLQTNSPTVGDLVAQYSSNPVPTAAGSVASGVDSSAGAGSALPSVPASSPACGSGRLGVECENIKNTGGSSSTTPAPAVFFNPVIQKQREKLISNFISLLRWRDEDEDEGPTDFVECHKMFKEEANAIGMSWEDMKQIWQHILKAAFPSPKPAPAPIGIIDAKKLAELAAHPECLESHLEADGSATLIFEDGMEVYRPDAIEPDWHPFDFPAAVEQSLPNVHLQTENVFARELSG